jgi:hypothetical protein
VVKFEWSYEIKASAMVASIHDLSLHLAVSFFFAPSQLHNIIKTAQVPHPCFIWKMQNKMLRRIKEGMYKDFL